MKRYDMTKGLLIKRQIAKEVPAKERYLTSIVRL